MLCRICSTVILVYDRPVLMAGIGQKQMSVLGQCLFFLQICSSIPTVLFRYFFHLETASLKTVRLLAVLISLGQLLSFNFNSNLKAGVKISTLQSEI